MRRFFVVFTMIVIVLGLGGGAFYWWHKHKTQVKYYTYATEEQALKVVREKLASKDLYQARDAVKILNEYSDQMSEESPHAQMWANLYLDAALEAKDPRALYKLYGLSPTTIEQREDAVLKLADIQLAIKNFEKYQQLRALWRNKTTHADEWFLLDADKMLSEGHKDQAIEVLKSKKLSGDQEKNRLIRLAILQIDRNPQASWIALNEAYENNPNDVDIHVLRAKVLEAFGKTELAAAEYVTALRLDPNKPELKDFLAEFFRRQGQYAKALEAWTAALQKNPTDLIMVKAWFWNRVFHSLNYDWKQQVPANGDYKPLLTYYLQLPPGVFWDFKAAEKNKDIEPFLTKDQSAYWLRVVQYLKDGQEDKALELLKTDPYQGLSWDRDLELSLKRILNYRKTGVLGFQNEKENTKPRHTLFKTLDALTSGSEQAQLLREIPRDLQILMKSNEAFAAAFAAAGWYEAALAMHKQVVIPENFPAWVTFTLTQAYQFTRGDLAALDFASKQKPTPDLDLLKGEILIGTNSPTAAIEQLLPLTSENSEVGARAAWLVALIYINQGEIAKAKEMVMAHTYFAETVLGKETLAKIAVATGDRDTAFRIYNGISEDSVEAKSYLAQEAYKKKDWKTARELTEELLRKDPNNMVLWKNLEKVLEKEKVEPNTTPSVKK